MFCCVLEPIFFLAPLLEMLLRSQKREGEERNEFYSELRFGVFSERVCNFSLRSRSIGPSDFFGPRRKVALRGEDYAWAPVLGSFEKLREVGVYPTYFTSCLSVWFMVEYD